MHPLDAAAGGKVRVGCGASRCGGTNTCGKKGQSGHLTRCLNGEQRLRCNRTGPVRPPIKLHETTSTPATHSLACGITSCLVLPQLIPNITPRRTPPQAGRTAVAAAGATAVTAAVAAPTAAAPAARHRAAAARLTRWTRALMTPTAPRPVRRAGALREFGGGDVRRPAGCEAALCT